MPYCIKCGNHISNDSLFCPTCGNRVEIRVIIQQQNNVHPLHQQRNNLPFKPDSCMPLAVFTTLCCCPIIGIYAMILSGKVDTLYYSGHFKEAEMKAIDSKKWSIIGIVLGMIINIILVMFYIYVTIITNGTILE